MPAIIVEYLGRDEIHPKESDRKVIELIHENYSRWAACLRK